MTLIGAIANGLLIGGVYALVSIGLVVVFGVMDIVNFAQGEFLMLGMFGAYYANTVLGLDPLVAAVGVGVVVFMVGAVIELILIEPIIRAEQLSQVLATVGLSIILVNGASVLFGNDFRSVTAPYQTLAYHLGPVTISAAYLYAFMYALAAVVALYLFLQRTAFGLAMRATAQDRVTAQLMGINARRVFMVAFGLGVALSGLAGAVIVPYTTVFPTVGQQYVLIMFTVVVLGGLKSIRGALIAGLVVGVVQSISGVYLPTELENLVVFLMFIAALLVLRGDLFARVRFPRSRVTGSGSR